MNTNHQIHGAAVYASLKAATRQLTRVAGGRDAAASVTRIDGPRLTRCGLAHETMFLPIDVVADLEGETGIPVVTRALAQANGHLLVPLPQVDGNAKWTRDLGSLAKEVGEAMTALGQGLADDGDITADDDIADMRKQIRDTMEVLARIDAGLADIEADAENGGGAA